MDAMKLITAFFCNDRYELAGVSDSWEYWMPE